MNLYPYQEEGARFLASRDAALLADDPGLGKTAQAINACDRVGAGRVLVICPASLRENWRREFARFSICDPEVEITSYDLAARKGFMFLKPWDVVILDEAHYLKNRTAKRARAVFGKKFDREKAIVSKAGRVWLLTGTPAPNNAGEMWTWLRALWPQHFQNRNGNPQNFWEFASRYCVVKNNGFGESVSGSKNQEKLRAIMEGFTVRRRKADVLTELPPISFDVLPLAQKDALAALKAAEKDDEQVEAVAEAMERGELGKVAMHVSQLRRATALAKVPALIDWMKDWFESGGGKLVVFGHHTDGLRALKDAAGDEGVLVYGQTTPEARQKAVDRFQTDSACKVFIGQIQAAGTGLTLTASSDVLFLESSWVPAENLQAAMRVHRIGQKDHCTVRFATLVGSLDERVQEVVAKKTSDLALLFD